MKNWIDNLISYEQKKDPGKCPFCDSREIEVEETNRGRRSLTFTCGKCGKSDHFDGIHE